MLSIFTERELEQRYIFFNSKSTKIAHTCIAVWQLFPLSLLNRLEILRVIGRECRRCQSFRDIPSLYINKSIAKNALSVFIFISLFKFVG